MFILGGKASTITLINNDITEFWVRFPQGSETLPQFNPDGFQIPPYSNVTSIVVTSGEECDNAPQNTPSTFIQAYMGNQDSYMDVNTPFVYLGVGLVCCLDTLAPVPIVSVSYLLGQNLSVSILDYSVNAMIYYCNSYSQAHLLSNSCI